MAKIGVDEAGKGPVLGSMFAAAVRIPDEVSLPAGIRDSKDLAPDRREELATRLRDANQIEVNVAEITPAQIDDPGTDMNTLTVVGQAEALGGIAKTGDEVLLDAGDVSESRFATRVADRVAHDLDVRAAHGADETYNIVSAASVVAKVERDAHVASLAASYDRDLGSGYPSDATTRGFLDAYVDEHGNLPDCARKSWQTSADILAARDQTSFDAFEE